MNPIQWGFEMDLLLHFPGVNAWLDKVIKNRRHHELGNLALTVKVLSRPDAHTALHRSRRAMAGQETIRGRRIRVEQRI